MYILQYSGSDKTTVINMIAVLLKSCRCLHVCSMRHGQYLQVGLSADKTTIASGTYFFEESAAAAA